MEEKLLGGLTGRDIELTRARPLITSGPDVGRQTERVVRRAHVGGVLSYYDSEVT